MTLKTEHGSNDPYRRTLDGLLEGCQIIGHDWCYRYINDAADKHNRRPKEELLGRKYMEMWPGIESTEVFAMIRRCLEERIPHEMENEFTHPDGTKGWYELSIQAVPEGVLILSHDITGRKRTEEALKESEARLKEAHRIVRLGSWTYYFEDRLWWSDELYSIYGVSPETFTPSAEAFINLIHPDDRASMRDWIEACVAGKKPGELEFRTIFPDGTIRMFSGRGELVHDAKNRPAYVAGTTQDITERKRAEEALRKSEGEFRRVINAINEVIYAGTLGDDPTKSTLTFVSNQVREVFGLSPDDFLQSPNLWFDNIHLDDREKLTEETNLAITTMTPVTRLYRVKNPQLKEYRWIEDEFIPQGEHGKVAEFFGVARDVTDKKKLEQQFLRSQRMESIGVLAGGIAHDMNNILGPIVLSMQLFKKKLSDPKDQRMIELLETNSMRGTELVKQILTFARGSEVERTPLQLRHLIEELRTFVRQTFPPNISIETDIPKNLWVVEGNPTQLHQVLLNLCVNARDAMPGGGTLLLKAENVSLDEHYARMHAEAKAGSYVVISVEDTGMGIPQDILSKIFDPFFTTKEQGKGTGLGLSTVYTIAKGHGGFVNVYSEVGEGTRFKVYFPATESAEATQTRVLEQESRAGRGEFILLVDDEAAVREITMIILEASGYKVLTANDGVEAISLYARHGHEINLVITDMNMPFLDGPALVRALHKMNPRVRIIGASGLAEKAKIAEAQGSGLNSFLSKPYTAEKLLKAIATVLGEEYSG